MSLLKFVTYEGCSKSSGLYLVALSRDIFERHTTHHSKELSFTLIMMLIFYCCTVLFNNYSLIWVCTICLCLFSRQQVFEMFIVHQILFLFGSILYFPVNIFSILAGLS